MFINNYDFLLLVFMDITPVSSVSSPLHSSGASGSSPFSVGMFRDSESSVSLSEGEASGGVLRPKILVIQNYAGTGGTEGVAEQIIEHGSCEYSFCELVSSVLRFTGGGGKPLFTQAAEVYSMDKGEVRKETEITTFQRDSFEIREGGGERPDIKVKSREISLKTGPIGERIKKLVQEKGVGSYYNLERAARTISSSVVGILDTDMTLHGETKELLKKIIEKDRPDVIYVAQDHATRAIVEVAGEMRIPIVYGIHREDLSVTSSDLAKNECVAFNASASQSGIISKIVGCSTSVLENFASVGGNVSPDRFFVVENGVDFEKFKRQESSRVEFREANRIPVDAKVVAIAGRYSQEKDFFTFIRSAVASLKVNPNLHFVMCGNNVVSTNPELQSFLSDELNRAGLSGLRDQFHLLGFQNMPKVFSGSDVVVSTSVTESWGLTLLEGAAAGNIIVHSDVPGMNHAMKEVSEEFRVTRRVVEGESFGSVKSPKVTDECVAEFSNKILSAVEASEHSERVDRFVDRARACSIQATVKSYEQVFRDAMGSL